MISSGLLSYLRRHGLTLFPGNKFPRLLKMNACNSPSNCGPAASPPASVDATQAAASTITTEGDPRHGGENVRRARTLLGTLHTNAHGHWIGAPRAADSRVFLDKAKALEWIIACEGRAVPRFAAVHEEPFCAAGMRHVVRGQGLCLHVCLGQDRERRPLVALQELIGGAGDYRPADLRAIAGKLNAIADDAEAQPMGKRSFFRSYRRY